MAHIHNSHLKRLDLGMLSALLLMLEQRSLSDVAREVGMSQPALSHALARMREIFDDDLLVREGNALVPTQRAVLIRDQLRSLVPDLQGLLESAAFDPASSQQVFKIAITDHAGQVLLPDVIHKLGEQAPHVVTDISIIPNRQTDLKELDDSQYDTRIGWLRSLPPRWRKRKLCDDRIVLIGAPEHPDFADGGSRLTIERFVELKHVALRSERPIYPNMVDTLLAQHSLERQVVMRVSHFSVVPFLLTGSRMVAMFPERLALKFADLGLIRIAHPPIHFPPSDLSLAWHPRVHSDPGHVWLRRLIVSCMTDVRRQSKGHAENE